MDGCEGQTRTDGCEGPTRMDGCEGPTRTDGCDPGSLAKVTHIRASEAQGLGIVAGDHACEVRMARRNQQWASPDAGPVARFVVLSRSHMAGDIVALLGTEEKRVFLIHEKEDRL